MTHPQVGGDTGEQGTASRDPDDAWKVGAGLEPDDAVEGEAAEQAARDLGDADSDAGQDGQDAGQDGQDAGQDGQDAGQEDVEATLEREVPHDVTDEQLRALDREAAP